MLRACRISLLLLALAGTARAQGAARSLDLDTSIRAAGMGGVSEAVVWGAPLDAWANPALLGLVHGLGYEWGRTRLVPGLANDVVFRSQRLYAGAGGVGIDLAGWPEKFGSIDLDYGTSEATDENGNPIGTFSSFERVRSFGFGVSLAGVVRSVANAAGVARPWEFDRFDAGWGATRKDVSVTLAPGFTGTGVAEDQGMYARVTPLLCRDGRVDLAYGHSVLNRDAAMIDFPIVGPEPTSRIRRDGATVHATLVHSPWGQDGMSDLPPWARAGFRPFLEVGGGWDHEAVGTTTGATNYDVDRYGMEVVLEQILTVRGGYVNDPAGDIHGPSYGFGVLLPIGRVLGVRYDFASVPQATGAERVKRHAVYAFFDPLAFGRALRPRDDARRGTRRLSE